MKVHRIKEIVNIVSNEYKLFFFSQNGGASESRRTNTPLFWMPTSLSRPTTKIKSSSPRKTWLHQMAWMPPTLKECPLAKDYLHEPRFH